MHDIERAELRAPARVIDIDVADADADAIDVTRFQTAWCLVRLRSVPVATRFLDVADDTTLSFAELRDHFAASNLPRSIQVPEVSDVPLTVVICTRDRPDGLCRTLSSLVSQTDRRFNVLVVDNSAAGEVAHALVEFDDLTVRFCHEPQPGKSRALNHALDEVATPYIAFLDDDEVADPDWISWIKRGFSLPEKPAAVTGVMAPAELETEAQVNFERFGGFHKGRGMEPARLLARTPSVPDPFFPLPNFGAGGNMACRTEALRAVGGFDIRLGPGTAIHGGEETRALSLILETGSMVLYWPPALTWHYHRRANEDLEKQFFGYTAGLTGFYMSLLLTSPKHVWRILRLVPGGVKRILVSRGSGEPGGAAAGLPANLLRARRNGLLSGAWLYLREAMRQRHPTGGSRRPADHHRTQAGAA